MPKLGFRTRRALSYANAKLKSGGTETTAQYLIDIFRGYTGVRRFRTGDVITPVKGNDDCRPSHVGLTRGARYDVQGFGLFTHTPNETPGVLVNDNLGQLQLYGTCWFKIATPRQDPFPDDMVIRHS